MSQPPGAAIVRKDATMPGGRTHINLPVLISTPQPLSSIVAPRSPRPSLYDRRLSKGSALF